MGIQGILRPNPGDRAAEVSLPRDHGYQQLGCHTANPLAATAARGTGPARARIISDAPSSSSIRQPPERTPQISSKSVETFYAWATSIGFTPSKDNLPYIQLGMVRTAGLTFLGWSAKAHSYIQRVAPQVAPPKDRDQLPLWHSIYFRTEYNCLYYDMQMIRRGVLTWGHFQSLEDARLMNALPRTWKGVYSNGGRLLTKTHRKRGLIPPWSMFKTGPERGCYSSMVTT